MTSYSTLPGRTTNRSNPSAMHSWSAKPNSMILGRIKDRGLPFWADPFHRDPGAINHNADGHGAYCDDPNGHVWEITTRS